MISILIPIYNRKVTTLVGKLKTQCEKQKIAFEIICLDDGSRDKIKKENELLRGIFGVNYVELSENIGRARIRNWLAKLARYDHLLFLDCDSIISKNFIKNYIQHLPNADIIYGGRKYATRKPSDLKKVLHWKYGKYIESLPAEKRKDSPYLSFMSNNFIIKAGLFSDLSFNEAIEGYGYEDLALAYRIKAIGAEISHIHNPVKHGGLDDHTEFIYKTRQAMRNLVKLRKEGKIMDTRLTLFYTRLAKYKALPLVLRFLQKNENKYLENLTSETPNLNDLQKLKIIWYHRELRS